MNVTEIIPRVSVCDALFERVEILEDGRALGVIVRETDGTLSVVRIAIEQVAD